MVLQHLVVAGRDDRLGKLRRQKPAQAAYPLQLLDLVAHLGFETLVQRLHLVVQRLDAQHGAHAGDQGAVVDRLGEVVVAAGIETGHDVLGRCLGCHQDYRDEGQAGIGFQPPHHLQPVDLGHHDVEQDQVGQRLAHPGEGLLAVLSHHHLVAQAGEAHAQDLDIVGNVIDDQDAGRVAHR